MKKFLLPGIIIAALVGVIIIATMTSSVAGTNATKAGLPVFDANGKQIGTTDALGHVIDSSGKIIAAVADTGKAISASGAVIGQVFKPDASAPTSGAADDSAPAPAEGSPILYISPAGFGNTIMTDAIAVRIAAGVFAAGDKVLLNHPRYKGYFDVYDSWDAGDGGGSAFIKTPYIDTGERNSLGIPQDSGAQDSAVGTISIVGEAAGAAGADGVWSYPASGLESIVTTIKNAPTSTSTFKNTQRVINKPEAAARKILQQEGKAKKLTGPDMRKYIRTNAKGRAARIKMLANIKPPVVKRLTNA